MGDNNEGPNTKRVGRSACRGRRGADLNDGGIPGPARVSGECHGKTGDSLAFAGADRPVGVVAAALVLHPVCAAARYSDQRPHYMDFGDVRCWLLDLASDVEDLP